MLVWVAVSLGHPVEECGEESRGQWASDLPALHGRGPPVIAKVHGWVCQGCPCPRQVVLEVKTVWVLNPHLGLWGTLPDSHIVGAYLLLVAHRHSYLACHLSLC